VESRLAPEVLARKVGKDNLNHIIGFLTTELNALYGQVANAQDRDLVQIQGAIKYLTKRIMDFQWFLKN
jgi:hypothetical protein